jgi:NAD(P)-dependent dehydrogenase (short-subunit alcohol dehydrogenase family)
MADRGVNDGVKVNAINPGTIATERLTIRIKKFAAERKISEDLEASELAKKFGISRFGTHRDLKASFDMGSWSTR